LIGLADELVLPAGKRPTEIRDRSSNLDLVVDHRGAEVFDLVRADDPRCAGVARGGGAAGRVGVGHRGFLHPTDELDVAGVAVGVDDGLAHDN